MILSLLRTYALLVFAMLIWGMNVVALKLLVEQFPPVTMQACRILLAGIVAIGFLYFRKELRKLTWHEWKYTLLAALFGVLGHQIFLGIGLQHTTASNGALILGLIPLTTSVLAIMFLHDRLTPIRLVGIGLGFSGVAFVVINGGGLSGIAGGDIIVFISMLTQAISFIIIKKVTTTLSAKEVTAVMLVVGSAMLFIASVMVEPQGVTKMAAGGTAIWLVFLGSAVFGTSVGHIIYNAAISRIGAGETAIFNNLVPFFALIGSFLFLGETISWAQVAGFLFIVGGVLCGSGYVDAKIQKRRSVEHDHGEWKMEK